MRVVIQRVKRASVSVSENTAGSIGHGLLVLLGIEDRDNESDVNWLCKKLVELRIFDDEQKVPNLSVMDVNGDILVVSQFTLFASTKKGNRPGYSRAAKPDVAIPIYQSFLQKLQLMLGKEIRAGIFGADMQVELLNDGPVTILIDTHQKE